MSDLADLDAAVAKAVGDTGTPYLVLTSDGGKTYRDRSDDDDSLWEFRRYYEERKARGLYTDCEVVEKLQPKPYSTDLNHAMAAAEKMAKLKGDGYAMLHIEMHPGGFNVLLNYAGTSHHRIATTAAEAICNAILEAAT